MEFLIGLLVGGVVGAAVGYVLSRRGSQGDSGELAQEIAAVRATHEATASQLAQLQTVQAATQSELALAQQAQVKAETQRDETAKSLAEQKTQFEQVRTQFTDTFKSLSGEALKSNTEQFLALANKAFEATIAEAKGDIGKKQQAVDALVKPMAETLKRYEKQVAELEKTRQSAYVSLHEQVKALTTSQSDLRKETGNLVTALRRPQVRGRWGELTLRRVVELAGMSEHCDFSEQVSVEEFRPDMVVHLPAGRQIVVDSKVALDGYLQAIEADNDEERGVQLQRHARQIREHMKSLSKKAYWDKFDTSPEFVVMFIPGDSFLTAALDQDHSLIEDALENRVVLATPTTLVAVLRSVEYGWRQEQVAENARHISDLGKDLYERIKTMAKYVTEVGTHIKRSSEAYNKFVGSLESRTLPSARRFKELGATGTGDIPAIPAIEVQPRQLTAVEFEETIAPPAGDSDDNE